MPYTRSLLLFAMTALFVVGLVMIFNASSAEAIDLNLNQNAHAPLFRQLFYMLLGSIAACGLYALGYRAFIKWSPLLLAFLTLLLLLVFIPGIGKQVNGSHRWIALGGFSLQPSEFVKILIPAFFIWQLQDQEASSLSFSHFFWVVSALAIPAILILIEPNHGSVAVIATVLVVLFFLMGVPMKYWVLPMAALLVVGAVVAYHHPYVAARLKVYLHPELDLKGKGHQPYQAKIAAGSGGLFGRGPGQSLQKLSYLPEAQNDYIAAIFAEEFGFIGILALISCYFFIAYEGLCAALSAPDRAGCYLAASLTFLICFQAFLNLGVVVGLLPSTGLNLPFFSQGGSSLIANCCAIGLICSVSAQKSFFANLRLTSAF